MGLSKGCFLFLGRTRWSCAFLPPLLKGASLVSQFQATEASSTVFDNHVTLQTWKLRPEWTGGFGGHQLFISELQQ
jgi:hypothetical protein